MECYQNNVKKSYCLNYETNEPVSFDELLCQAFYPNGKKDPHQYRIPTDLLNYYKTELAKLEKDILCCVDFDEILAVVSSINLNGIGVLTKYDVGERIGNILHKLPDKVYLHAGTKQGAKNLNLIKNYSRKKYLTLDELPDWLTVIEPHHIESFLCIYKETPFPEYLSEYINQYV